MKGVVESGRVLWKSGRKKNPGIFKEDGKRLGKKEVRGGGGKRKGEKVDVSIWFKKGATWGRSWSTK